jgi:flagellar assembly factor FliW
MSQCKTKYFGELEYDGPAAVEFREGLPGFEKETQFLLIERPDLRPLVFMQSLATPGLCFMTLPVFTVATDYRLEIAEPDRSALDLPAKPVIGRDVACLVIANLREDGTVTVNLLAPLVVDLKTRRAVQSILSGSGYSHEYEVPAGPVEAAELPVGA